MPQLLTTPEAQTATQIYRFYCQLAHRETDWEGVTLHTRMIDVVVTEPTREALADLIMGCEWLADYQLVSFHLPEDGCSEF